MSIVQYEPLPPSRPGEELELGPAGDVARLRAAAEYAGHVADTEFVPTDLRGRAAAVAAAILAGGEVGLRPMASLRTIAIIKGKPSLTAEAQRALIISAGHEIWFDESTITRAIAAGRRAGSERIVRITWTTDDARRAGLLGQHNWRAYPAEMLRARSSAALARAAFADVTLGIPAAEELDDEPAHGPPPETPAEPPADATPAPAPARTRKRASSKRAPAPPAADRQPLPPTPPPDEGTRPEPPPEPPDPPATGAQKRQIFALMRDVGMPGDDREGRLAYTRRVVGRADLGSSNELTMREAGLAIDDLQAIRELPADELAADDERTRQAHRITGLFDEKSIGTAAERLSYANCVIDREVASVDDLTEEEGSTLIAHLEQYDADDPQTWPFPDGF